MLRRSLGAPWLAGAHFSRELYFRNERSPKLKFQGARVRQYEQIAGARLETEKTTFGPFRPAPRSGPVRQARLRDKIQAKSKYTDGRTKEPASGQKAAL